MSNYFMSLLFFCLGFNAQAKNDNNGVLFKLTDADTELYIFGVLETTPPDYFLEIIQLKEVFNKCNCIVGDYIDIPVQKDGNVHMESPNEPSLMVTMHDDKDMNDDTLFDYKDYLTTKQVVQLRDIMEKLNITEWGKKNFYEIYADIFLNQMRYLKHYFERKGIQNNDNLKHSIMLMAKSSGKTIDYCTQPINHQGKTASAKKEYREFVKNLIESAKNSYNLISNYPQLDSLYLQGNGLKALRILSDNYNDKIWRKGKKTHVNLLYRYIKDNNIKRKMLFVVDLKYVLDTFRSAGLLSVLQKKGFVVEQIF